MTDSSKFIRWFDQIRIDDIPVVGGKTASLGEMYQALVPRGVQVPNGFAVTAEAYRQVIEEADILPRLRALMDDLEPDDAAELAHRGAAARRLVYGASLPIGLRAEILSAYRQLGDDPGQEISVAVRSSATAEDLPTASFAGQQDTFLNVVGDEQLLDACRRCFASLFTDRAIHYRMDNGFDHFDVALSICVMRMVRSDRAASGVIFTLDTETGFRDVVFITGAHGLGENVVQGSVDPDEFYVHKPTFESGHRTVLRRSLGAKKIKMVYASGRTREPTRNVPTSKAERASFCIPDEDVLTLAGWAIQIESYYSERAGKILPMDIEWAKDGFDGQLYVLQARPETAHAQRNENVLEIYTLEEQGEILAIGHSVGTKVATGLARVVPDTTHLPDVRPGEVLVVSTTSPDWEPVLKTAAAVVTDSGGRTCHAAIVAREMGISAIVGCGDATSKIENGCMVTVSCCEGEQGLVYRGEVPFSVERLEVGKLPRPKTRIMLNIGNPDVAFQTSFLPNDGVGLARMEFIINDYIKVHPMALVHPDRVEDPKERAQVLSLARGFDRPSDYFVQRLSEGVGTIAAAFYPKPVVVRLSDFKTNEYASLIGGRWFEPQEANPMLGFRGASRYSHPAYAEGFALECAAMKRVLKDMGLTNVKLMIPFCRRVQEARTVLETMASHGLVRGEDGLEIYVMCEIPNNVIQIDAFAELFDGFSIGSNDLTQLTLGVDRDSDLVAFDFDERDEGVKMMIHMAVEGARRNGRHSGLCGQAPSDYPEMAEYLVELGIDSMSLSPDSILKMTRHVLEVEARLGLISRNKS